MHSPAVNSLAVSGTQFLVELRSEQICHALIPQAIHAARASRKDLSLLTCPTSIIKSYNYQKWIWQWNTSSSKGLLQIGFQNLAMQTFLMKTMLLSHRRWQSRRTPSAQVRFRSLHQLFVDAYHCVMGMYVPQCFDALVPNGSRADLGWRNLRSTCRFICMCLCRAEACMHAWVGLPL